MKFILALSIVVIICISDVSGNICPRTNKRPGSECVDECQPSIGCSDSKKECLCDGDCGYSCVKKSLTCSAIKKPRNGRKIGNDRRFNATVNFVCDPNYTLFGSGTRTCRAKGLWDGKKSRCKISCPDPGIPGGSNRRRKQSSKGFTERTTLRYMCLPGYITNDPLNIRCLKNGQWTSSPPVCKVQQCGKVKLPANSFVRLPARWKNKASNQLGTKIYLMCQPGYHSVRSVAVMQCKTRGWTNAIPGFACRGRSCGDPGTPWNGKKSGVSYTLGDVVRYSCDGCYKLIGASYRQCLADGSWSDTLPVCTQITCPAPRSLANGTLRLSSRPIYCGSYVDYTCSIGYNLKGSIKRTCLSDGSWSGDNPVCEIVNCGDPGRPVNGLTKARGGFTYGNDATFSCYDNYVLEGSLIATCQDNGKWSKSPPICLEKCSDPSGKTNAYVHGDKFYHGKEVEFSCRKDYTLVPSRSKRLTCQDGDWGTIPSCKAPCPPLSRLSDGHKYGKKRTHGAYVDFQCAYGHRLVGSQRLTCNDGAWSDLMPRCLAICRRIQRIGNGWIDGKGYLEGDTLSFRCRTDYVLDGERSIACTGNRRWSHRTPTCRAPCRRINAPDHGRVTQKGFRHNEVIKFECDRDYYLQGSNVLTCSDGRWNADHPTCLAPCKKYDARPFAGGYIKRNGYKHNEEVTFGCREPYAIDGKETLRCDDGTWSNRLPSCGAPCRRFASAPTNGEIVESGFKHKETVRFRCKPGFQMVGTPDRLCNFGVWDDSTLPRCEAKCLDPSTHSNAQVLGSEFHNGKEVEFRCVQDYVLEPGHSKKLTCENGRWNGKIPSCKAPCPHLPQIQNGNVSIQGSKSRTHGSVAIFSCKVGYQQIGPSISDCTDGNWNQQQPQCLQKCPDPLRRTNATVIGSQFYHGQEIEFACPGDAVLHPSSSRKLRCQDGDWEGVIPSCQARTDPPSTVMATSATTKVMTQAQTDQPSTVAATSATTKAITAVRTIPTKISTTSDAKTKISAPAKPKFCPEIPTEFKRKVQGSGVSPGSERTFSCAKNWKISGAKLITCLDNGQWSAPSPTCKLGGVAIDCPVVHKIEGGFAIRNESFHGGRMVFQCNPDYKMTGKRGRLCKSGKWNRPAPKCLAPCVKLRAPKNGFIQTSSGNRHGGVIVSKCNQGYTMLGSGTMVCSNGSWNDVLPVCQKTS